MTSSSSRNHADESNLPAPLSEACPWCAGHDTLCTLDPAAEGYGLTMTTWTCHACGCLFSPEATRAEVDYAEIRTHHAWYRLAACAADHVARLLGEGPEQFWVNEAVRFLEQWRHDLDRRYDEVLRHLTRATAEKQRLRFIEVGFGWGAVCGIAARLGHETEGFDINGTWIEDARTRFHATGAYFKGVAPDWFEPGMHQNPTAADLVFCGEVIEHAPTPRAMLDRLCELVAPGGTLVLTTPAIIGQRWGGDPPPVHRALIPGDTIADTLRSILGDQADVRSWREDLGPDPIPGGYDESRHRDPSVKHVHPSAPQYYALPPNHTRVVQPRATAPKPTPHDTALATAAINGTRKLGMASVITATRPL